MKKISDIFSDYECKGNIKDAIIENVVLKKKTNALDINIISDEYIQNVKDNLPELPESRYERYVNEYNMSEKDAGIIVASKYLSDLFENASNICNNHKAVSNWIISDISRILNEKEMEANEIPFTAEMLAELVILIDKGTISSSIGKKVIEKALDIISKIKDIYL